MAERAKLLAAAPYLAALAAAGGLYGLTYRIPAAGPPDTPGPAFWPRVAIAMIAIVALVEVARIMLGGALARAAAEDPEDRGEAPRRPWLLAGGVALVCAYAAAITTLGYILASFLFLVVFMYLGRYRNHLVIWTASLLGMAAIAFVFLKIVYVSLPRGVPPFNGMTHSLLGLIGIR